MVREVLGPFIVGGGGVLDRWTPMGVLIHKCCFTTWYNVFFNSNKDIKPESGNSGGSRSLSIPSNTGSSKF